MDRKDQTAAANKAWRRKGDIKAAKRLRAAGWIVMTPERVDNIIPDLRRAIKAIASDDPLE